MEDISDLMRQPHAMPGESLDMWVVYVNPSDYPSRYVVRRWTIDGKGHADATIDTMVSEDLYSIRTLLTNLGLVNIGRRHEDDPVILEVWI